MPGVKASQVAPFFTLLALHWHLCGDENSVAAVSWLSDS